MTTIASITTAFAASTICVASITLIGCADQNEVVPSDISLEKAMRDLGSSMVALKQSEVMAATNAGFSSNYNQGLMPSQVQVTFNLAASKGSSNQLMIAASSPPNPYVSGNLSGSASSYANGSRASSITITLSSLYFNSTSTSATSSTATTNSISYSTNAGATTNGIAFTTNSSHSITETKPSNLNDPTIVKKMLDIIRDSSKGGTPDEHPYIYIKPATNS